MTYGSKGKQISTKLGAITLGLSIVAAILLVPVLTNTDNTTYAMVAKDKTSIAPKYCNYSSCSCNTAKGKYCGSGMKCRVYQWRNYDCGKDYPCKRKELVKLSNNSYVNSYGQCYK
jgi:hypothetical protein